MGSKEASRKGGLARAAAMTAGERSEAARVAGQSRWLGHGVKWRRRLAEVRAEVETWPDPVVYLRQLDALLKRGGDLGR